MWEHLPDWQTFLTGGVTAVGAYFVAFRQSKATVAAAKAQADAAKVQATAEAQADVAATRGPDWNLYVERLEKHFDKRMEVQGAQLAEQSHQLAEQSGQITGLSSKVRTLEEGVAHFKVRYDDALDHIVVWRDTHPESVPLIPVTPALAQDIVEREASL